MSNIKGEIFKIYLQEFNKCRVKKYNYCAVTNPIYAKTGEDSLCEAEFQKRLFYRTSLKWLTQAKFSPVTVFLC